MNRLGSATSPYLLQHRDNPVDWWEWTDEAFEEAKRRDVPVLISVGYAACHWCHVMAHESFEDDHVGGLINEQFVAIKVDREERPDVDAVYMSATQAMTGQGGWPMTVFATPDGQPFYCGTYFPKQHFTQLVQAISEAWRTQRADLVAQGEQVVEAVAGQPLKGSGVINSELMAKAVSSLERNYDSVHGGFGGAPKFPPHMLLLFLLRHHQRTGNAAALEMAHHTCEAMARGGLFDQVGGGFHRYTVDGHWVVPHFEKMLYDNALLLRVYTELWRLTEDPLARRIAYQTMGFLLEDLGTAEGGFASALDADTDGVEGLTYAWSPGQLREVLGEKHATWVADLCGITEDGTFEHGLSVVTIKQDIDQKLDVGMRWATLRQRLKEARDARPQPQRDDKVVAAWNGLAITALCEFARVFEEPTDPAIRAGELLATVHMVDGRLRRVSRNGIAGEPQGVLEDYGCVAEAFCALHQVTGDPLWLDRAKGLLDTAIERFAGFYDTADDAQQLFTRPADPTDNATPSGLSSLINALVTATALTGETRYREIADDALSTVEPLLSKHPRFAGYAAAAAEAVLSGPYEIAIVTDDMNDPLIRTAVKYAPPGAVIVAGAPDQVPLLRDRVSPAAYVCLGFVCERPVTTTVDLTTILTR